MKPEQIVFMTCLGLKQDEKCLIVSDINKKELAEAFFEEAQKIATTELIEIPEGRFNGEEPPAWAAEKMMENNVCLFVTSKSLSWTEARVKATENGARIGSMPGITRDIVDRAIDVDYKWMKETTNKIADLMDEAKTARVTTELGTDITFSLEDRKAHGRKAGLFVDAGDWGNLPEAEAFISPVEGKTNGVYIVDASQAGVGKLEEPIKITVEDGWAVKIEGGKEAKEFAKIVESVGDNNAYNIAELGIGTNPKAKVTGIVLEDEKVFGTCHVALGKNSGFGGKVDVPFHVDGVMNKPTIYLDDKKIMEDGKLLI